MLLVDWDEFGARLAGAFFTMRLTRPALGLDPGYEIAFIVILGCNYSPINMDN